MDNETAAQYLNEHQLAQRLSLRVTTLRGWRLKKVGIPYSKFEKLVRYSLENVLAYEEAARKAGEQA